MRTRLEEGAFSERGVLRFGGIAVLCGCVCAGVLGGGEFGGGEVGAGWPRWGDAGGVALDELVVV